MSHDGTRRKPLATMIALLVLAASASPCADSTAADAHTLRVDLVEQTVLEIWTVRFDSTACANGPEAPDALPGAEPARDTNGAWVLRRTYALDGATSASLHPYGAPAHATVARFITSSDSTLQVFAPLEAHQHAADGTTMFWWPGSATQMPELVWSSWSSWSEAGTTLAAPVRTSVPTARELGDLGRSLRGAELPALVSRLDARIQVRPDAAGWNKARPIGEILESAEGTPSERARILLAMLKGAGYRAAPAWFIPEDDPVLPRTLPAPHLLPHPAIAVRTNGTTVYIDPGARGARPPEIPARILGGRLLEAGRHLVVVGDTASPRGEVRIEGIARIDTTGRTRVIARLRALGAAEQFMRGALEGTDAQEWPEIVGAWMTPRGELRDLVVGVEGLDGMVPFAIEIRFTEPTRLSGFGPALKGPLADLIAPGLAHRLPSGIAIAERMQVVPPEGMFVLTALRPESTRTDEIVLNRSMSTDARALTLSSDWRVLTGTATADRLEGLAAATEVLVFPEADRKGRRAAHRLDLPKADLHVVEAMLLWRLGEHKKARRQLDRLHPDLTVAELVQRLALYVPPGDRRPWEALVQLVHDDTERIAVIDGLVAIGDHRLAWQLATALTQSTDAETQIRALVEVARLQGPQPNPRSDPEGSRAWREPIKLLETAATRAGRSPVGNEVRVPLARAYVREGRAMEASDLLDRAMDAPDALTHAVYAEFGGITGVYGIDVLGHASTARALAPYDPDVREAAGRALAAVGRRRQGVAEVLLSAELAGNDLARWMRAAELAATYGDLRAAVFASRRASDLAPTQLLPAIQLQRFASLAADGPQLEVARERTGESLYSDLQGDLPALIAASPEDELALLRHHVVAVEASRSLLRRRAELHYARGMIEDASLDGSLLLDRHRDSRGIRYLTAGVTTRTRHLHPTKLASSKTQTAREARMDLQIVMGLRVIPTGARGKLVTRTLRTPGAIAAEAPTWPLGLEDFEHPAPEGFVENRLLSSIAGVRAWTDPARQMAILRTERSTGDLPPPIAVLFDTGPTVLSTDRGASIVRLDGGALPIYAGITIHDGQDVIGLGLSPQAARDAVLYGIGALVPPDVPSQMGPTSGNSE